VWLGLAAQASFAWGDRFAVIRYLREASRAEDSLGAWASIAEIRELADDALNEFSACASASSLTRMPWRS
jgi:hypothetical protein